MKSFAEGAGPPGRRLTGASTGGEESRDMPGSPDEFARYVKDNGIDFLDFGCSGGGSLKWAQRVLGGGEGLGIDIAPKKIAQAREAGWRAVLFDINKIPDHKLVRFTILSHFLEHVADLAAVRRFILKACRVSAQFVLIKQPYFDADGYLLKHGLKTFWSDWRGHPNMMSTMSLYQMLRDLRTAGHLARFSIHARGHIQSSADPRIHPLQSPIDQHQYDPARHPPKPPEVHFEVPVYYETVALVTMTGVDHREPFRRLGLDYCLFEG
jgi:SAM-dependent methyltransferase